MSMKSVMTLAGVVLLPVLVTGCTKKLNIKKLDYAKVSQMPGYGYITMDFRQGKELAYGDSYTIGKADYTIMYSSPNHEPLFVDVKDAPFDNKVLKAMIPYYDGYEFRDVYRMIFLDPCDTCWTTPRNYFVTVYSVQSIGKAWCQEVEYKNEQTFNYDSRCPNDTQDKKETSGLKDILGDIYITPHFKDGKTVTFTNMEAPVRASVGS